MRPDPLGRPRSPWGRVGRVRLPRRRTGDGRGDDGRGLPGDALRRADGRNGCIRPPRHGLRDGRGDDGHGLPGLEMDEATTAAVFRATADAVVGDEAPCKQELVT